jgi:signal peptidase I
MLNQTAQKTNQQAPKKSPAREWFDSFIFAVVVATFVRWIALEAFTIPTSSMENSLLVGDFLFVSKLHYGARTPKTILQIPLSHQKIWGTNMPSYLDWLQLPQFRLPGFSEVKKGDAVVFNYPDEMDYPVDLKTYYIKRCVATAGDKFEVREGQVYINGQPQVNATEQQTSYIIKMKNPNDILGDRYFESIGIRERREEQKGVYSVNASKKMVEKLTANTTIASVTPYITPKDSIERDVMAYYRFRFYNDIARQPNLKWNKDNFGEYTIPAKGMKIAINPENLAKYGYIIERYEDNKDVKIENGKLSIGGNVVTEYTFKQNYYFMMGDNRHNSLDSRFWGCVPEDHVVGKALFIWLSMEQNTGDGARLQPTNKNLFERIRWSRLFNLID